MWSTSAPASRRTVDRVDPDDNERQERLAAIQQTSGSADGVFSDGYLGDLRDDWPDSLDETTNILANPDLVTDIEAGLADAEAGRVHTHDEVAADLRARQSALAALVSDLDAIHGKPDAEEVARFARGFLLSDDDGPGTQAHNDT